MVCIIYDLDDSTMVSQSLTDKCTDNERGSKARAGDRSREEEGELGHVVKRGGGVGDEEEKIGRAHV